MLNFVCTWSHDFGIFICDCVYKMLVFKLTTFLILFQLTILIILSKEYKLWSSFIFSFLKLAVTSSLFGPEIFISTLFSNILSLCSSLNAQDQVLHLYNTTYKMIFLYMLNYIFCSMQEDKRIDWMVVLPKFNLLLNTSSIKFCLVTVIPKYLYRVNDI
jgi:hypothetical protein